MKSLLKKIGVAGFVMLAGGAAALADPAAGGVAAANADGLCGIINEMYGVFKVLRTLAFVGAAFIIAGWAWGYISAGKGVDMEDLKKKGTGMLVGFVLLFGIGVVLQFFIFSDTGLSAIGCEDVISKWGML
mgnify:CR=1 FL=1